jgi:hypothetical protein
MEDLERYCDDMECHVWAERLEENYGKSHRLKKESGAYLRPVSRVRGVGKESLEEFDPKGRNPVASVIKGVYYADHSWVVAPDGTIIDTTHGQFDRSTPILIAPPGSPEHRRYLPTDRMDDNQLQATYGRW